MIVDHARIVLADEVVSGSVAIAGGRIAAIDRGRRDHASGLDFDGDFLLPGLIDLHTDNLEKHVQPRAGVVWDPTAAAIAHDAQIAAAGITTVFDSLTLGAASGWHARDELVEPTIAGLEEARTHAMLRIDHRLHLRLEVTHEHIVPLFEEQNRRVAPMLVSLMDHAPGDRQSPDVAAYRRRYLGFGMSEAEVERHMGALIEGSRRFGPANARALGARARAANVPLATHDDASPAHVALAVELGARFTEFPTTLGAAEAARAAALPVLMGTPNLLRGGSHSGNVAAGDLAQSGLLDLLASDYIPSSLLQGVFRLTEAPFEWPLYRAVATVTAGPARAADLDDRGRIAIGLRADFIRVRLVRGRALVRGVWCGGRRVA
ncbi:MAG: alpha-D-ribose 1-methylphosphonate 5-triphosphate diphosphatase [Geminicoccaceae bacterium]|nr:alpha-D-ribose 1-methylphosphonate 5-triphosphate diphosphatase [Geminicoccaceae bacterium]